ncbi:hypothetical protein CI109_101781 [Kwoniella shandongensis]|uniref:Uncharacterized protein n=1 Tax=Kwoniella shandongensis TaxID=1734106 RepID=A0A5M6C571_9TREE|nr:uncharacterized protein CI109_001097 [Kwoniella shandongensis]KAA5530297.1 hypothetical protein CI109_001097 [Kwoniella shandongensis]
MSNIAANLILHPKMSQSLAVLATTIGRDKAYRLIQYLSRLIAWSLLRRGNVDAAARWEGLKNGFATGRRVMRLFRPAEFLQSAMNLAQRPVTDIRAPQSIAHLAQIGRQLGYAGFFTSDMMVWLGQIGFLRYDKEKLARFQRLTFKFWLAGIISSLISSSASLVRLRADSRRFALSAEVARREAKEGKAPEELAREEIARRERGRALLGQRQSILSQLVLDSFDIWIPATGLGYANLSEGALGALGAITSYMSLQVQWQKHAAAGVRKKV